MNVWRRKTEQNHSEINFTFIHITKNKQLAFSYTGYMESLMHQSTEKAEHVPSHNGAHDRAGHRSVSCAISAAPEERRPPRLITLIIRHRSAADRPRNKVCASSISTDTAAVRRLRLSREVSREGPGGVVLPHSRQSEITRGIQRSMPEVRSMTPSRHVPGSTGD